MSIDKPFPTPSPLSWAVDTFGSIAVDRKERAMRLYEEVTELCQSSGLTLEQLSRIAVRTYERPVGAILKEMRQVAFTVEQFSENEGHELTELIAEEFSRVRTISREEWRSRHKAKSDAGTATAIKGAADDEC